MSGFIKLHRGWQNSDLFHDEPYCERAAWLWLISNAAWKDTMRRGARGQAIPIKRGQIHTSLRGLASVFNWSKSRVDRFLNVLEIGTAIEREAGQSGCILTICNYDKYQANGEGQRDTSGTPSGTPAGHERDTQEEGKEIKEEKKNIDFVEIQSRWNAIDGVTKCTVMSKARKAAVKSRIAEHSLEAVWSVFAAIAGSKFHLGDNDRGWVADIDHAFQPSSFLKHLEKGARPVGSDKPAFANDDDWDAYCEQQATKWDGIKPDMAADWRARKKRQGNVVSIDASAEIRRAVSGLAH